MTPRLLLSLIVVALSMATSILITLIVFSASGTQNSTREGALWLAWFVTAAGLLAGVIIAFADAIAEVVEDGGA